jgi:hypothetical protein
VGLVASDYVIGGSQVLFDVEQFSPVVESTTVPSSVVMGLVYGVNTMTVTARPSLGVAQTSAMEDGRAYPYTLTFVDINGERHLMAHGRLSAHDPKTP